MNTPVIARLRKSLKQKKAQGIELATHPKRPAFVSHRHVVKLMCPRPGRPKDTLIVQLDLPSAKSISPQTPWKTARALSSLCNAVLTPPSITPSFLRPKRSLCHLIFSFLSTLINPLKSPSDVATRLKVTTPVSEMTGASPSASTKNSVVLTCMICSLDHV